MAPAGQSRASLGESCSSRRAALCCSAARALLPDADDVAGGVAEERHPEVSLRVRLGGHLAASGANSLERLFEVLDEDVDADAVRTGDRVVAAEVADDVAAAVLEGRVRAAAAHLPAKDPLVELRRGAGVGRGDAQVRDPAAPEDRVLAHRPAFCATNAATSRICAGLSPPANEGIPPPPSSTFDRTVSKSGRAESRFGPIWPPAPAASSVWQDPQPAVLKTVAPAAAFAAAGTDELFAGAGAAVFRLYSQSALVHQTPISTAKSSPPATGSTSRGKRCSRTIVTFAAKAP